MRGKIYYGILIEFSVYIADTLCIFDRPQPHLALKWIHDAVKSFLFLFEGAIWLITMLVSYHGTIEKCLNVSVTVSDV